MNKLICKASNCSFSKGLKEECVFQLWMPAADQDSRTESSLFVDVEQSAGCPGRKYVFFFFNKYLEEFVRSWLWLSHMFDLQLFCDGKSAWTFNSEARHYEWIFDLLRLAVQFFILSVCFHVVWTPSPQAALRLPQVKILLQEVQLWLRGCRESFEGPRSNVLRWVVDYCWHVLLSLTRQYVHRFVIVAINSLCFGVMGWRTLMSKCRQKCASLPNCIHIVSIFLSLTESKKKKKKQPKNSISFPLGHR